MTPRASTGDDDNGFTPLIAGTFQAHVGVTQRLIRAKANLGAADRDGNTAIMWACIRGHAQTLKVLLLAGVQLSDSTNKAGLSALGLARVFGTEGVVEKTLRGRPVRFA